mmetsp:Transcript_18367/g.40266  ORF Transcript_18367/g.40266 Transcript_18367/m.40266 type:complete len:216 (-) Transcript_18367:326-973(-)
MRQVWTACTRCSRGRCHSSTPPLGLPWQRSSPTLGRRAGRGRRPGPRVGAQHQASLRAACRGMRSAVAPQAVARNPRLRQGARETLMAQHGARIGTKRRGRSGASISPNFKAWPRPPMLSLAAVVEVAHRCGQKRPASSSKAPLHGAAHGAILRPGRRPCPTGLHRGSQRRPQQRRMRQCTCLQRRCRQKRAPTPRRPRSTRPWRIMPSGSSSNI